MAIHLLSGKMLSSNLLRDDIDLSVATDVLYVDVSTGLVGINNETPTSRLDVTGDVSVSTTLDVAGKATVDEIGVSGASGLITATATNLTLDSTAGHIDVNSNRILNCADPAGPLDVVNLQTLTLAVGGSSANQIIQGDSSLTVVDVGTGSFDWVIDTASVATLTSSLLSVPALTSTGAVSGGSGTLGNLTFNASAINTTSGTVAIGATNINLNGSVDFSGVGTNQILFANTSGYVAGATAMTYSSGTIGFTGVVNIDDLTLDGSGITSNTAGMSLTTTANGALTVTTGSGIIDLQSSSALQLPSGTTLERPGVTVAGYTRWNETLNAVEYNDGPAWHTIQESFVPTSQQITPDGSSLAYTLSKAATADTILVIVNGIVQDPTGGTVYTVSGTTLTFTSVLTPTDIISVRFLAI